MNAIDTLIIAGGKSSRMNSQDKFLLPLADKSIFEWVLASAVGRVFVASHHQFSFPNITVIKDLSLAGGPAVGVWSCLSEIESDYVLLLAADQPIIANYVSDLTQLALRHPIGAWLKIGENFQPLASCVKRETLKQSLAESKGVNISLRKLLECFNLATLEISTPKVWDIDTWSDYFHALALVDEKEPMTEEWVKVLIKKFQLDEDILNSEQILNLTREVAHAIERKAAPLTTFLLGFLAGKNNLSAAEISEKISQIEALVEEVKGSSNE